MHTENEVTIRASVDRVYGLAAAVEEWPAILPHYRWVRVVDASGDSRLVEMAARRGWIPVSWRAEQRLFPEVPRITFRHVHGITRGMEVEWSFTPTPYGVRVAISHDLLLAWPLIGAAVADFIIGPQFVANIAGKTLRRIKALAEAAAGGDPAVETAGNANEVRLRGPDENPRRRVW